MNFGKESEITEFKESTGEKREGIESMVSILNKHGYGTVYFGVKDNGNAIGQIVSDSTLKDLGESIMRDIEPKITPTIEVIPIENKAVIKISFSGRQFPYSAYGKFLTRVGTQNRKMSRDELVRLVKKAVYSLSWESEGKHTIDDIDDSTLLDFYQESISCGRLDMKAYDKEELLTTLEVCFGKTINNAGYAIFGKGNPVSLKAACFATDQKITFLDLKEFHGNIYQLIHEAEVYILSHINTRVDFNSRKRLETPEIPERAIHEMVINAFAHADYRSNPEIEIDIHPHKVTIYNPGSFPDDLTPYDFISKNIASIKRNPLMLGILFRCKDVEKSGTGFRRMNQLCQEAKVEWEFRNTAYGFYFDFIRPNVQSFVQAVDHADLKILSDNEAIVYQMLKANPKIRKEELEKALGRGDKTIQRILTSLTKKGFAKRIGKNQYGYWEILK